MMLTRIRIVFAALVLTLAAGPIGAATLIDCSPGMPDGDNLSRGFYIPDYPGSTLDGLDVYLSAVNPGPRTIGLTVRLDAYDGPTIVATEVAVEIGADPANPALASFVFPEVSIPTGSTVTFMLGIVQGEFFVFYDVITDDPECPIIQTNGITPPLDTFRRQGIRATIYGTEIVPATSASWSVIKGAYR